MFFEFDSSFIAETQAEKEAKFDEWRKNNPWDRNLPKGPIGSFPIQGNKPPREVLKGKAPTVAR